MDNTQQAIAQIQNALDYLHKRIISLEQGHIQMAAKIQQLFTDIEYLLNQDQQKGEDSGAVT